MGTLAEELADAVNEPLEEMEPRLVSAVLGRILAPDRDDLPVAAFNSSI